MILPSRFKKQPQYPAPIDRSGIGERARFVLIGSQPKAIINGTPRTGTAGTSAATPGGIGYVLPGSVSNWVTNIPGVDPAISGAISVFWHGVFSDNTAQRLLRSAGATYGWTFGTTAAPTGSVGFNLSSIWHGTGFVTGNIPSAENTVHSVAIVWNPTDGGSTGTVELFFDGVSITSGAWTADPTPMGAAQTFSMFSPGAKPHKMLTVQAYEGKLSARDVRSLSDNPWQIFKAPVRRLRAAADGGATHDLTAASATQVNVASTAAVTQTHVLAGANAAQANTSSTGAITQTHVVAVQTSAQPNTASAGGVTQTHALAGASSSQANTGTAGAVSQTHAISAAGSVQTNTASTGAIAVGATHNLAAAAATQANIGTPGAISQVHALVGVGGTQTNTGTSAAVSQAHVLGAAGSTQANAASVGAVTVGVVHDLAASPSTQTNAGASGAISQAHALVCPASVQDNIAAASAIVQTHILMGASSTQPNACSTGAIEQHSGIPPVDGPAGSGPRLRVPHGHRPAMRNTSRPRQVR